MPTVGLPETSCHYTTLRNFCCGHNRLSESLIVYVDLPKFGKTNLMVVDHGVKINGIYYRDIAADRTATVCHA